MDKEKAIQIIESLFPADSKYPAARETGLRLLEQAKQNVLNWRDLANEVLFEYARLCEKEEKRQADNFLKRPF
jgi:hypothetical protein